MSAAVSLKTTLLGECASTEVALVGLFSSVDKLVSLKMFQKCELLATFCTLMLLDTSVDQFVALQGIVSDECLTTFITLELLQFLILLPCILLSDFDLGNSSTWTNRLRYKNASLLS